MSREPKITSKNLSYDTSLPPFLAALRGHEKAARDSDVPDAILASRRRAGRVRSASEEAEDAPLVVDEAGNVVSLQGAELPDDEDGEEKGVKTAEIEKKKKQEGEKEKVAGIGAGKKRKVGRVVGGEEDDDEGDSRERGGGGERSARNAVGAKKDTSTRVKSSTTAAASAKPTKKKAKKIKLSFGDEEGD